MKKSICILVASILSLIFISQVQGIEVFRCQGNEVRRGDTTFTVLKKCGKPAYKEEISAKGCEKIERWHYDCKNRRFVDELTFTAGKLTKRTEGERSSGSQGCP